MSVSICAFRLTSCREKSDLTDEAHRIIKTIKQMEASLEDHKSDDAYQLEGKELKVTVPLTRCLQGLKEKHNNIAKIHRERFEQIKSKYRFWNLKSCTEKSQNLFRHSNLTPPTLSHRSSRLLCRLLRAKPLQLLTYLHPMSQQ